jgi:hypothetical protein
MHDLGVWLLLGCTTWLFGCEYVRPTMNAPLARWDEAYGYRSTNLPPSNASSSDSLFIVASFSGGGTRASALAYGVLQELARTSIRWEGIDKRLVDELNIINALSGGSFTAAYYGLYGDRIFQDFEHRFLRKNWESELWSRIFRSPSNWLRLWSPYFGRAHIFSELLDEALFDGHTFGDLVAQHRRPMIFIHASDMVSLSRFEFNQIREVLENTAFVGDLESTFMSLGAKQIRKLVYLIVNAETRQDPSQYTLNNIPGLMRVSQALVDIPIDRYSTHTIELLEETIQQWRLQLRRRSEGTSSSFAPNADIYFINVSLTEVTDPEEESRLMNIPTNLALTNEEVDHLLLAGSRILRDSPEFQRLISDLGKDAEASSGLSTDPPKP